MLKRIIVMDRTEAVRHTKRKHVDFRAAMLSIGSTNMNYVSAPRNCTHVPIIQTVMFDDIVPGEEGVLMTEGDAEQIAAFVDKMINMEFETLIFHCNAGMSRSAAVAKAAAEYAGFPVSEIEHKNPKRPNPYVYELTKTAFAKAGQSALTGA